MAHLIALLWQGWWQLYGARYGVPFDVSYAKFALSRQVTNQWLYRYVMPRVSRR